MHKYLKCDKLFLIVRRMQGITDLRSMLGDENQKKGAHCGLKIQDQLILNINPFILKNTKKRRATHQY